MDQKQTTSTPEDLATLIESEYAYVAPRPKEIHEAVVLAIQEDEIFMHLPRTKRDGIVPAKDLTFLDNSYRASLSVGDHIPVQVMRNADRDGYVVLSINQGLKYQDWLRAEALLESGEVAEAEVIDFNRGGVIVSFGRLRGFVPNSHLVLPTWPSSEVKSELVGETLSLVVIEVNQRRRRLVLSERKARSIQHEQLFDELAQGQVHTGIVRNVVDYGAFVDLGGAVGLIHISELDWDYIEDPRNVLSVGDEVKVMVLNVDQERERIALSRKRLLPTPWELVTSHLEEGDVVRGTVTDVAHFGAFVEIREGVEGLVLASQMPAGQKNVWELEPGSKVTVRVLDIEDKQEQITLEIPAAVPA